MDEQAQTEGEKRVDALLIVPLENVGLAKPTTATKAMFETQKCELRQKLAYMSDAGLVELREWVEAHPAGKEADRFPIPLKILRQAAKIETPEAGVSPFVRKVMTHAMGQDAVAKGWAPELLVQAKAERGVWPGAWTISRLKEAATDANRRLEDIELRLSRGQDVALADLAFRDQRRARIRECEQIAGLASDRGAA